MTDIKICCAYTDLVDPISLIPNPRNPNTHPKKQIELYAKLIRYQGWRRPVTVSNRSGFVVRGHGALEAAMLLNCMVPVDRQDYETEADEWSDLVADNRLAELSEIDDALLAELLQEIGTAEMDISLTGYSTKQIDSLLANLPRVEIGDDDFDAVAAAEAAAQAPRAKRGDIWQLGRHRLMCGDSTVKDEVAALMNGEHPTMKPIPLCARAIQNSSQVGDIVLDLFGGSGSTLIAAEQTGRRCYCMEQDPIYVNVILRRWEAYAGQKATLFMT